MSIALQADADPAPEFLFVNEGFVLADTDGTVLAELDRPTGNPTNVVVTDLDGDGAPDVALDANGALAAYHLDGTALWERAELGGLTNVAGWDIDGDGASEVIAQWGVTEGTLTVLSGRFGEVLFSTPNATYGAQTPVVADIDGDGHAELLVSGGAPRDGAIPSLTIYHQADDTWPAAGPSWPIPDFRLTDLGPSGEIPRGEPNPPPWSANVFHARPAVDGQGVNLAPIVSDVCVDACAPGGTTQLDVVVSNTGTRAAANVVVRVYAGDTAVAEAIVPFVDAGTTSAGTLLTFPATAFDAGVVRVEVDPDNRLWECDETTDGVEVPDPR